jgi:hypothetical protein
VDPGERSGNVDNDRLPGSPHGDMVVREILQRDGAAEACTRLAFGRRRQNEKGGGEPPLSG